MTSHSTPFPVAPTLESKVFVGRKCKHLCVVSKSGPVIPQDSLVELKTARLGLGNTLRQAFLQLYLSQTPHLFVGIHLHGLFEKIERIASQDMVTERKKATRSLQRLVLVLHAVRQLAIERPMSPLSLVFRDRRLCMYERRSREGDLQEEMARRFFAWD